MHHDHQVVATSGGPVEVVVRGGPGEAVLYFHGGHESATAAPAAELYAELGFRVVRPSRPGYGRTAVGELSPARFAALADEVRATLGVDRFRAVVGTSFGGPQAVEYAGRFPDRVESLVLHSAAPSTRPYPDSAADRFRAPLLFHPRVERYTWAMVAVLMRRAPELGLRSMVGALSARPDLSWLDSLDEAQRQEMRDLFCDMRSGSGFLVDLHHAGERTRDLRREAQRRVACPALVTASHDDGAVAWDHAEDFLATVPGARLTEVPAPSHLFWIGPTRAAMTAVIREFLATTPS